MVNTRLFLFCPISPFKHFLSLVFNLKKKTLFIFMRNSEICTCSSCQKRTPRIDPRKKQHEICCKFKLLSVRKKKKERKEEKRKKKLYGKWLRRKGNTAFLQWTGRTRYRPFWRPQCKQLRNNHEERNNLPLQN